jgi:hypothetical protein
MKSLKQKDQAYGYAKHATIRTILNHYKTKLEDLSMEELEEELYAEEETTKFGEIIYQEQGPVVTPDKSTNDLTYPQYTPAGSLLNIGLEQGTKEPPEVYEESIIALGEDLVKRARKEGFTITPKHKPETD